MTLRTGIAAGLLWAAATAQIAAPVATARAQDGSGLTYRVSATKARAIGLVTGDVVAHVQGVPAEPVDAFVHDGNPFGIQELEHARVTLEVDPIANTGSIEARWTDVFGQWRYRQSAFAPPPHPAGLRLGPSASESVFVPGGSGGDPVTTNVYLHGDTKAGEPVLPTLFALLATWGPARVTLNGEPFENPYDGPAPLWIGHTMTTVGVRQPDGTVHTTEGEVFSPMEPGNGVVEPDDFEFHLVFHDAPGPVPTTSYPAEFSFFYHLQFEEVKLRLTEVERVPGDDGYESDEAGND